MNIAVQITDIFLWHQMLLIIFPLFPLHESFVGIWGGKVATEIMMNCWAVIKTIVSTSSSIAEKIARDFIRIPIISKLINDLSHNNREGFSNGKAGKMRQQTWQSNL